MGWSKQFLPNEPIPNIRVSWCAFVVHAKITKRSHFKKGLNE